MGWWKGFWDSIAQWFGYGEWIWGSAGEWFGGLAAATAIFWAIALLRREQQEREAELARAVSAHLTPFIAVSGGDLGADETEWAEVRVDLHNAAQKPIRQVWCDVQWRNAGRDVAKLMPLPEQRGYQTELQPASSGAIVSTSFEDASDPVSVRLHFVDGDGRAWMKDLTANQSAEAVRVRAKSPKRGWVFWR